MTTIRSTASLAILPLLLLTFLITGCGLNNDMVEEYNNFGVKCAKMGLWNEAVMRWKRVLEIEPDNAQARNNLGVAYESRGELEEAMIEYKKAIELDPGNKIYAKNYSKFTQNYERVTEKDEDQDEKP